VLRKRADSRQRHWCLRPKYVNRVIDIRVRIVRVIHSEPRGARLGARETAAQAEMAATGDLSWCGLRRLFVVHHKAGTIFMERSSELLNRELQRLCRHHTMAKPIEVLDCGEEECRGTSVAGACSLHLERNPFEVVVSGYLYHRSNAEPEWEEEPMDAAALNVSTKWAWKYHRALQRNIVGERHDALPRPSAHESYAHFLQRIDETQGLQAEARFASAVTIDEMVALHQRAMSHAAFASSPKHACSAVACFSEFEGDVAACVSTWSQRLLALQFPAGIAEKLARVASSQCPGSHTGSQAAASHSATGSVKTPLHTLVARLAAYDLAQEGGKLAAADRMLGCPLGGKYLGPPSVPTAAARQPSVVARGKKARQGVASWDGHGSNGITSLPQASPACAGWCYRANFTRTRCAFDACWGCAECPCNSGCYGHAHAGTPWSTKCGWEKGACWGCAGCRRNCTEATCRNRQRQEQSADSDIISQI